MLPRLKLKTFDVYDYASAKKTNSVTRYFCGVFNFKNEKFKFFYYIQKSKKYL